MDPTDIEHSYNQTYQYWKEHQSRYPEPLKFEIPKDIKPNIGAYISIGQGTMNQNRYYGECRGSTRNRLKFFSMMCGGMCIPFLVLSLIHPSDTTLYATNWQWLIIFFALSVFLYFIYERYPRKGCHIFDRDTGKIHLYMGKKEPHLTVNFYEQYFYLSSGHSGWAESASLYIKPRIRREDGTFDDSFPAFSIAWNGKLWLIEYAWYFLVHYIDKNTVFNQEELDFFETLKQRQKKQGFKIEGQRFPDGTVEWL